MSEEEQHAAIGRTVEEYVESRKTLAALQSEVSKAIEALASVQKSLMSASQNPDVIMPRFGTEVAALPSPDRLRMMTNELKDEADRKKRLYLALKNMGMEPKE